MEAGAGFGSVVLAAIGDGAGFSRVTLALLAILIGNGFILWSTQPIRSRVSPLLVGVFVLSIGTTIPELAIILGAATENLTFTSATFGGDQAGFENYKLLAGRTFPVAVVIGSSLANLLLVTGLAGLLLPKPFEIENLSRGRDLPALFLAIVAIGAAMIWIGRDPLPPDFNPRWIGYILVVLSAAYVIAIVVNEVLSARDESTDSYAAEGGAGTIDRVSALFYLALGAGLLFLGVHTLFSDAPHIIELIFRDPGCTRDCIDYHTTPVLRDVVDIFAKFGLLFVGLAVALPEILATLFARLRNQSGVVAGNLIGASVFNLLFVLGIGIIVSDGRMAYGLISDFSGQPGPSTSIFLIDLLVLLLAWVLLVIFFRTRRALDAWEGAILVLLYVGYWIMRYNDMMPALPIGAAGA